MATRQESVRGSTRTSGQPTKVFRRRARWHRTFVDTQDDVFVEAVISKPEEALSYYTLHFIPGGRSRSLRRSVVGRPVSGRRSGVHGEVRRLSDDDTDYAGLETTPIEFKNQTTTTRTSIPRPRRLHDRGGRDGDASGCVSAQSRPEMSRSTSRRRNPRKRSSRPRRSCSRPTTTTSRRTSR